MPPKLSTAHQTGDTIVEVLLCIAIVGAVLVGAYASSQQSTQGTRRSDERGTALKLVEGQMERLKSQTTDAASPVYLNAAFCFDSAGFLQTAFVPCSLTPTGVTYKLDIQHPGPDPVCQNSFACKFIVTATWDRFGGSGTEQLQMTYKAYPQ